MLKQSFISTILCLTVISSLPCFSQKTAPDSLLIKQGIALNQQGNKYMSQDNIPEALNSYLSALRLFEKSHAQSSIAGSSLNIGRLYWMKHDHETAMKYFKTALNLYTELKDQNGIAGTYNNMALIYEEKKEDARALKYYQQSIEAYNKAGNKHATVDRYFNLGFFYEDRGNYAEALKNHLQALQISREIGSKNGMAAAYANIAEVYNSDRNYKDARENYLQSLRLYKDAGNQEGLGITYSDLAGFYIGQRNFPEAKKYLAAALPIALEMGSVEGAKQVYGMMATTDSALGDWKAALEHYKLSILYRDSLENEAANGKLLKAQMQYDYEKKEEGYKDSLALLQKEKDIQLLQLKKQRQQQYYLLALAGLLLLLSFFVYQNFRTKQRLKLQALRNKIASDLHDEVGSTLSSISIFSEMAQQQSKEPIPVLETIGESSRKTLDAMADIVWTINPENDQFEKIILRMKNFAYELLGAKGIDFEFRVDEEAAKMNLAMDVRKNLYLVFKEATNNLVKHSGADKAMFAIKKQNNDLVLMIRDNGKGFINGHMPTGNGLVNMQKRSVAIKAHLEIDANVGSGTTIQLTIPT